MSRFAVVLHVVAVCGGLPLSSGCSGPDPGAKVADAPLGWGGPVNAEEVREWPEESLDAAPRWVAARVPVYSVVSDSVEQTFGGQFRNSQRYVGEGAFLSDGRVALVYSTAALVGPDSLLLHFVDPASGDEDRVLAPKGDGGEPLNWTHFVMTTHEQGFVLVGDNQDVAGDTRPAFRTGQDVWYADRQGQFARPASFVNVLGSLLGVFPDGSLVMSTDSESTDTTIVAAIVSAQAAEALSEPPDENRAEVLFTTANPRDPGRYDSRASWAPHPAHVTAVAGDTVWVVPTERPELLAVHRSGGVALKVEWDAGHRTVPPGLPEFWDGAERYPAVARMRIGADGLLYVQRWSVVDRRGPWRGPEWLVFTQAGELVARLHVPREWRVLAFGHNAVLAVVSVDGGPEEVRVHAIERQSG